MTWINLSSSSSFLQFKGCVIYGITLRTESIYAALPTTTCDGRRRGACNCSSQGTDGGYLLQLSTATSTSYSCLQEVPSSASPSITRNLMICMNEKVMKCSLEFMHKVKHRWIFPRHLISILYNDLNGTVRGYETITLLEATLPPSHPRQPCHTSHSYLHTATQHHTCHNTPI